MKTFVVALLFATFAIYNVKGSGKLLSLTLYDLNPLRSYKVRFLKLLQDF